MVKQRWWTQTDETNRKEKQKDQVASQFDHGVAAVSGALAPFQTIAISTNDYEHAQSIKIVFVFAHPWRTKYTSAPTIY